MAKVLNLHRLLEYICREGFEGKIIEFAIWTIVCQQLDTTLTDIQRREKVVDRCQQEIDKWIKEV